MATKTKTDLGGELKKLEGTDAKAREAAARVIKDIVSTERGMFQVRNDPRPVVSSLVECLVKEEKIDSNVLFNVTIALKKINAGSMEGNIAVRTELIKNLDNSNVKDLFAQIASRKDRSITYG